MSRFLNRYAILFLALAGTFGVTSCANLPRTPYNASEAASSSVLDLTKLRRYSDDPASSFDAELRAGVRAGPLNYLALSGGGADGAYGAGVMNGWTSLGSRPDFDLVSGVSAGALIAPFAFLGSDYDPILQDIYTSGVAGTLLDAPDILNAIFGSGLYGNARLRELVAHYVDRDVILAVARAHAKGRFLLVVTTDLDTQRTVIWNMGRIASIGSPQADSLFRDVLSASASIPAIFPPMLIEVESDGHRFQEMHVDGGVTAPVLTLPEAFLLRNAPLRPTPQATIYILMNDKIERDFRLVPDVTIDIVNRASESATKTLTRSILSETYKSARRNKLGFNLTYIEKDIQPQHSFGFETKYMKELYRYGFEKARMGALWVKEPPYDMPLPPIERHQGSANGQ